MQQLLPIENPRGMAGLAKQKFAGSYREFDTDPTDPGECPHRQRSTYCHLMHRADDSGLLVPPAYISADNHAACSKESHRHSVRLAAAPIECNTKHGVAYTKRKCQRCGTGVDNEHHLLFECSHVALVASRSKHRALFDGVRDVREWMTAAYRTGTSSHSRKLHARHDALFDGWPSGPAKRAHRLLSWADVTINKIK